MSLKLDFFLNEPYKDKTRKYIEGCFSDLFSEATSEDLLISSENEDDISLLKDISSNILQNFDNVIIVGTGASYTIPKMMIDFGNRYKKNFIFLRNYDSETLQYIKENLAPEKTVVISISKSGESLEVICNTLFLHNWLSENTKSTSEHFFVITEENHSKLFAFAEEIQCHNLSHANIGGRFAVFTKVGLLPAMLAGFDVDLLMQESKNSLHTLIQSKKDALVNAVTYQYENINKNSNLVLLSYGEKFSGFNQWLKQLLSESLGKENKGFVTIDSIGSYDQHIQLQLFLDGNKNLFYKLISSNDTNKDTNIFSNLDIPLIELVTQHTFSEHLQKNKNLVTSLLKNKKKEILEYNISEFNEKNIVELINQNILEIMLLARAMEINPFGQPAVENIKTKLEENLENDSF